MIYNQAARQMVAWSLGAAAGGALLGLALAVGAVADAALRAVGL